MVSYGVAAAANLITDGRNGVLVRPGEEREFIQASVALALDNGKRDALRREAAGSVAHMSWMVVTDGYISTLRATIERHDNPSGAVDHSLHPLTADRLNQPSA